MRKRVRKKLAIRAAEKLLSGRSPNLKEIAAYRAHLRWWGKVVERNWRKGLMEFAERFAQTWASLKAEAEHEELNFTVFDLPPNFKIVGGGTGEHY